MIGCAWDLMFIWCCCCCCCVWSRAFVGIVQILMDHPYIEDRSRARLGLLQPMKVSMSECSTVSVHTYHNYRFATCHVRDAVLIA